ncbi:MAG: class II fructose-bisphosphatase [Alphaproteobacteria bacterium]
MSLTGTSWDSALALDIVRVTERTALAVRHLIGRGQSKAADQAAVDAMRSALNQLPMKGRVVIGEGERDEAPMLFIGEEVGTGEPPEIDIALDPLEGTNLTAKAGPNALAVMAFAERGNLLHAPDVYMSKIAVGGGLPGGVIDLDADPADNVRELAKAKGVPVEEITACVLERPRHDEIIDRLRSAGAAIRLIPDGDVAGVIHTAEPASGIDIYMGIGGAPEGVLAAAALACVGGQMETRLVFRNDDERERARRVGINDLDRKYAREDMARGPIVFSATGVTHGTLVKGVHRALDGHLATETLFLLSRTGAARSIRTRHALDERV